MSQSHWWDSLSSVLGRLIVNVVHSQVIFYQGCILFYE